MTLTTYQLRLYATDRLEEVNEEIKELTSITRIIQDESKLNKLAALYEERRDLEIGLRLIGQFER